MNILPSKIPVSVTIDMTQKFAIFKWAYDEKCIDTLREVVPNNLRDWRELSQEWYIPIRYGLKLYDKLSWDIRLVFTGVPYTTIKEVANRPDIVVEYKSPNLVIENKSGRVGSYALFGSSLYDNMRVILGKMTLPLINGERLVSQLDRVCKQSELIYHITPEARELINEQVIRNKDLDTIALLTDAPDYNVKSYDEKIQLMPFQRVTQKFAEFSKGRFLNCDEMGLGKSFQAIALAYKHDWRGLFIVPPQVIPNWIREIKRFTGQEPVVFRGKLPSPSDIMDFLINKKQFNVIGWSSCSTEVEFKADDEQKTVSYRYPWIDQINMSSFDFIALDEVHRMKNETASRSQAALQLSCPRIMALSGTPVLNRPGEYFNILHLLRPDTFKSRADFMARYTNGKNGARNVEELRYLLKPLMIRRTKKDVQKDLPPITRNTRYIQLDDEQKRTYAKLEAGVLQTLGETGEIKTTIIPGVLAAIMAMKQFTTSVKTRYAAEYAQEIYEEAEENEDEYRKIILFSQFRASAARLQSQLGNEALHFDGTDSPEDRQEIVDRFQNDPSIRYLCVTTKSASEGLNITAAGHVIFVDLMWTPADHQQAEGRAYGRLGDSHTIDSHYFVCPNTIDDMIWEMLEEKLNVIEEVVDGVANERGKSGIIMEVLKRLRGK